MQGFVSVLTCMDCGIPTDRNCVCVVCEKRITPYRLRDNGKMCLIFVDDTHLRYIADVSCQRCGATEINDYFDDEGTCYNCQVHNSIKPCVMGQWYFFQYHVTMAPVTTPIKNVIKEIPEAMAKKLVRKMGVYIWEEDEGQPRYQTSNMGKILGNIKAEAGITNNASHPALEMPGIDKHIDFVHCLACGVGTLRVDKSCQSCGTRNDIVIEKNIESGEMYFINITHVLSTGEHLRNERKRLECPYCNKHPIVSLDLKCSLCDHFIDAKNQKLLTVNTIGGVGHRQYHHEVHLHPHNGDRPPGALTILGASDSVQTPASPASSSPGSPPHFGSGVQRGHPNRPSRPPEPPSSVASPPVSVEYPMVKYEQRPSGFLSKVFGRSTPNKRTARSVSARTKRRQTKAARDGEKVQMKRMARHLKDQGHSLKKISEALSDKFGKNVSIGKVRNLLKQG